MQNSASQPSGGLTAAKPASENQNHNDPEDYEFPPRSLDDFQEWQVPEWVHALPDKSCVKWQESNDGGFFYVNEMDFQCGLSHDYSEHPDKITTRVDYDFGPFGKLRALIIDGEAWCLLDDAGRIVGIPGDCIAGIHQHTGEYLHVRGGPGYLNPDGIRYLRHQEIHGHGIRIEAVVKHVEENRRDDPRVMKMLKYVITNVYVQSHSRRVLGAIPVMDVWPSFARPKSASQIHQLTFHDPFEGEVNMIQIGTQFWLRLEDLRGWIPFASTVVTQIAGEARTLKVPDSMVYPLYDTGGEKTYVRADALTKLFAALPHRPHTRKPFVIRTIEALGKPKYPGALDGSVMASTLHQMLGFHLEFKYWNYEIMKKWYKIAICLDFGFPSDDRDYEIPLMVARDIAAGSDTFAGKMTALLLTDGGFLHGGPINETPDETLRRFKDLIPDRHGRVRIRKIWEFLNCPEPFETWVEQQPELRWYFERLSDDPMIYSFDAGCGEIHEAFDSDHYGADLK